MKVKILSDTTCDLSDELLKKYNVETLAFPVVLGDKQYLDGVNITPKDIIEYNLTNKAFPKTTAPNMSEYMDFFSKFLDGDTEIVFIGLSSELSSCFNNMKLAAGELKNVYFVDSKSLSTGTGLLVIKAAELAKEGKSALEIVDEVTKLVPKVQASFVVEKLDYLRKGGRCSMLAALGANLLKIKPMLLLKDGKIIKEKTFIGKHNEVLKKYISYVFEKFPEFDDSRIFITHTMSRDEYIDVVKDCLKDKGFKEVLETNAGSTVTCHCGPNTIGILYLTKWSELLTTCFFCNKINAMKIHIELYKILVDIRRLMFSNIIKDDKLTNEEVLKIISTFRLYDLMCLSSLKKLKLETEILCSLHPNSRIKQIKNMLKTFPERDLKKEILYLPHTDLRKAKFERVKKELTQIYADNPSFYYQLKHEPSLEKIINELVVKYNFRENQNK